MKNDTPEAKEARKEAGRAAHARAERERKRELNVLQSMKKRKRPESWPLLRRES